MSFIHLERFKQQQFIHFAKKIIEQPEYYLDFESVADVYRAGWLEDFPKGTTWQVSGLDNGAEEFCLVIAYVGCQLSIDYMNNGQFKTQLKCPEY